MALNTAGCVASEKLNLLKADAKDYKDKFPPNNIKDGDLQSFVFTSNGTDGIWIRVFLDRVSNINHIKVFNRPACCMGRIIGMSLYIKNGDKNTKFCGKLNEKQEIYTFHCQGLADTVEISAQGNVIEQNIAEIVVFGRQIGGNNTL